MTICFAIVAISLMKQIFYFVAVLVGLPLSSFASGLDLTLHYGSRQVGLGGQQVSESNDAYAPFYNPAGLVGINKIGIAANSSTLITQYSAPINGDNQQRNGDWNIGPLFYVGGAYRLTDRVVVGMGVYPTALQGGKFSNVDYSTNLQDKEWSNRLVRIEIAPSVGVNVYGPFSLGLSYRAAYTKYDNKIGTIAAPPGLPGPIFSDTAQTSWDAKGLKVGALLKDFYNFSVGLTWRFKQSITLDGTTTTTIDIGSAAVPSEAQTKQKLKVPSQLQIGVSYDAIPETLLFAFAYEWTGNDVIKTSEIINKSDGSTVASVPLSWRNGHAFHLGSEYTFHLQNDRRIRTQAGFALDQAVTRASKPNPVIAPASDYLALNLGGQYEWGHHIAGAAINYGQYSSTTTNVDPLLTGLAYAGKYKLQSIMAVIDYQWNF